MRKGSRPIPGAGTIIPAMDAFLSGFRKLPAKRFSGPFAAFLLVGLFLLLRLPSLGSYVTADEALWLRSSANFYYAIGHAEWEGTIQSSHPGVTTMWAGAAAFHVVFPEYQNLGQGEISDFQLRHLLLRKGINPVELLATARAFVVAINALAFALLWPLMRKVFGYWTALAALLLIANDPFLIGHQRLLHQDGLLASFTLLSLVAFFTYRKTAGPWILVLSGIAAGLAGLTKSPGWLLIPFLLSLRIIRAFQQSGRERLRSLLVPSALVLTGAGVSAMVLYPALWSQPAETLSGILHYALDSAEGLYSGPVFFASRVFPNADLGAFSWIFYPLSVLWRSTPLTAIGLGMAALALFRVRKSDRNRTEILQLLAYAFLFMILMSLGTKKFDRYYLPGMILLQVVAAWAWVGFFVWVKENHKAIGWRLAASLLPVVLLASQLLALGYTKPYFITYYNPLLGGSAGAYQGMQMGWGEGMEQAAHFLLEQPNIENKSVSAWYSTSFNLLFEYDAGHIPITPNLPAEALEAMLRQDYLVIYLHQWQRATPYNLLAVLDEQEPIFEYELDGLPYVRIYRGAQ